MTTHTLSNMHNKNNNNNNKMYKLYKNIHPKIPLLYVTRFYFFFL